VVIDFHCHITTPGSRFPDPDGPYYRAIAPVNSATNLIGHMAQDAIDLIAERWRSPQALQAYRNVGPVIFTEMSRRMITTDASRLLGEMAANGVSKAVVVAMDPFVPTGEVLHDCEHRQGILLPFGSVDNAEDDYLDRFRCLLTQPIAGIKYHSDLQQLPLHSPKLSAMMEILRDPMLPIFPSTCTQATSQFIARRIRRGRRACSILSGAFPQ